MHHLFVQFVFKGAVMLVDIEIVILVEIVADIDIGVAVQIDIGNGDAEAVADHGAMDSGCFGDVGEVAVAVVAEKPVAGKGLVVAQFLWRGPKVPFWWIEWLSRYISRSPSPS